MPIYEYRCEKCGSDFEVIQRFSDKPLKSCSKCKGRLAKLISQTSFQLKGAGWYVTDYAKSGKTTSKSDESPKPDESSKPNESSKPAAESSTKSETPSKKEPVKKAK